MKIKLTTRIELFACVGFLSFAADAAPPEKCEDYPDASKDNPQLEVGNHTLSLDLQKARCVQLFGGSSGSFIIKVKFEKPYDLPNGSEVITVAAKDIPDSAGYTFKASPLFLVSTKNYDGQIIVTVDRDDSKATGYTPEYLIHADGIGTLDPKVRVIGSSGINRIFADWLRTEFPWEEFGIDRALLTVNPAEALKDIDFSEVAKELKTQPKPD